MNKTVGIIDSKICNIHSISNMIKKLGRELVVVDDKSKFDKVDRILLPGVGAYPKAMENLDKYGLLDGIVNFAKSGKPVMGICLGMQLMFDESEEFGVSQGLGLIPGRVVKIKTDMVLPHMGWNDLTITQKIPLLANVTDGADVYFVHTYRAETDAKYIAATANYSEVVPAVVCRDNIVATQFHPEKSLHWGEKIISAFFDNY